VKRFLTLLVLGMGALIVVPGVAKKKPAKPTIEIFEATVPGGDVLRFEIEESSTDEDIQELAKAYAKSGKDGLRVPWEKSTKAAISYAITLTRYVSCSQNRLVELELCTSLQTLPIKLLGSLMGGSPLGTGATRSLSRSSESMNRAKV
jgi:hypothetical protein